MSSVVYPAHQFGLRRSRLEHTTLVCDTCSVEKWECVERAAVVGAPGAVKSAVGILYDHHAAGVFVS